MYIIVGLQNPGTKYENTRHNAGGIALRAFCKEYQLPSFVESSQYSGETAEGVVEGAEMRVLLPTTFMNNSGVAVKKAFVSGSDAEKLIVVHDDLDLPIGSFRVSYGKGSGGHNGLESVIGALGSNEFVRVRIGVSPVSFFGRIKRPTGERAARFVLQDFTRRERAKLDACLPEIVRAIHAIVTKGKDRAMNEFNKMKGRKSKGS